MAHHVPFDEFAVHLIVCNRVGAWSDDAHAPLQHVHELGQLVEKLRANPGLDQRWVSIGATHLQQGLMGLTRSVAQPTFF